LQAAFRRAGDLPARQVWLFFYAPRGQDYNNFGASRAPPDGAAPCPHRSEARMTDTTRTGPPLRIAYLCDEDPTDLHSYSGGNARILAALRAHVGEVTVLSHGWHAAQPMRHLIEALPDPITMRARWRAQLALAPAIARGVSRELRAAPHDVLFCAYSFHALSGLRLPRGMLRAYTSDATPTIYRQSEVGAAYGSYLSASRLIDPLILRAERRVFRACDALFWPSAWLHDAAIRLYGLDPARAHLVPWGAGIADPGAPAEVPLAPGHELRLLLLGRDWHGKGGPLAAEVTRRLREAGHAARLTVIGCVPPEDVAQAPHVTVHPHLDKSVPAERALLETALAQAHFMLMPSFESYGFAFCEASAYGLPSLCLDVGGVPVRDGVNGHALPPDAGAAAFCDVIAGYLDDPARYRALRSTARSEYLDRLNWRAWGGAVRARLAALRAQQPVPQTTTRTVRSSTRRSVASDISRK
jgi:glycosyltransferase involved in cell wall biosynthesis